MPEGHTLHRLAGEVAAAFGGRRVAVSSPQGRFAESAALVDGAVLVTAEAAGKHLLQRAGSRCGGEPVGETAHGATGAQLVGKCLNLFGLNSDATPKSN